MAGSMRLSLIINADGTAAIQSLNRVKGEVDGLDKSAQGAAAGGLSALGGQLKSLAMTAAAGIGVAELARAFITAATESQRFQASLTAITGSTQAAGAEMDYIKAVADRLGITLADTATAWISLSAASKGTALEGQAARDIFEAVGLAMGKLGKSSADTQGALLAIEQMISKGVVSAEELRGQLGERLPGAFKAAADAMGRTEQELGKMLESGEVMAEDLLPALSQRLRELYNDGKEVGGLEAEWNRLTNAMGDLAVTTDQATGATGLLAGAIQSATALARDWEAAIRAVSNAQRGLGFTMGERDELAMLYRERTQLVNEYLGAVERANQAGDLSKTPGLAFARDEALAKLAQAERSIQAIRGGLQATAAAAKEAGDAQARSMGDDAVKLYEEQRAKIDEANQSLLKLNSTYDDTAKRQYQVAEATKQYQEIAKSLGKDEAWVSEQVAKYTASLNKSTQAKGGAAKASKTLSAADRESAQAVSEAERAVQSLIDRYLPARAAAEDYAEAQAVVAAALAGKAGSVSLSAEEADKILAELGKEQAKVASEAAGDADAFADAWKNVVDSLDDTFQGLWRSLITGQGDVLGNLKETVLEWVADLSYQLLLSPLIVPIQGALMGIMGGGAAGVTGTATSMLGTASSLGSMFSGFSSLASGVTSLFSGATAAGITAGWGTAMAEIGAMGYGGAFTTIMGQAGSLAASGNIAASIGAAAPYLLPAIVAIGGALAIFNKWQSDQEPRYGTLAAMTGGSAAGLEDAEWGAASGAYVKGSFGLNFGLTDKGSKNMEATELREVYQALADVSDALAEFFGEDLSSFIEAELQRMSDFGDGLIHLTEDEGDLGGAMAALVERIAQAAGRSAEDIGIAFGAMVGDLSGTAEEVGEQIQAAMVASALAVELSDRYDDSLGQMLDLTGDITGDVKRLKGYIDQFGESGETSGETLARLVTQLGVLDTAAQQTATDLDGLSATALIALSDELVAAFGGVDAATQAQAFYYQEFTTGTEKLVDAIQAAAKTINREIPKLQDELIKLSEDIVQEVELLDDLPKTRQGFEDLIAGLDLTTEAGRKLYAGLLELAQQFDLLYDGVEAFEDWLLGVDEVGQATRELERVFQDWGLTIPENRDALKDLYDSGILTTEQMAILGAYLKELGIVFGEVGAAVTNTAALEQDLAKQQEDLARRRAEQQAKAAEEAKSLAIRLAEAQGNDELALRLRREQELAAATSNANRAILRQIYALEDEAAARARAVAAAEEAKALNIRLAEAMGDDALVLRLKREAELAAAADDANREILKQIYALEDEAAARAKVLAAQKEAEGLAIRLAEAQGNDELALRLRREQELAAATSDANREILKQIYALEDAAAAYGALVSAAQAERDALEEQYQARMTEIEAEREAVSSQHQARLDAIAAEREALSAQHQGRMDAIGAERDALGEANRAQMDALGMQRDAAQEALSAAEAGLSRIQSALDAFRDEAPRTEMERLRALRQLGAWAASGRLPDEDSLDRAITGATNLDAQDFTTEASYRAAQGNAYSALLALEKVGVKQVSDAERQIAAIETASERAQAAYEAQIKALDEQADQAAAWRDAQLEILARQQDSADAWRDAELARLEKEAAAAEAWREENLAAIDDLLELAEKQLAILNGTYEETKSLADAIKDFNAALVNAGGKPVASDQAGLDALLPPMTELVAASTATTDEVVALRQEIVTLRRDLAEVSTAQVVPLKAIDERLRKWDLDGLPGGTDSTTDTALRAA